MRKIGAGIVGLTPAVMMLMGGGGAVAKYTISGTVYDADGSTAVASATIALGALTATSGEDGAFTVENIPAGTSGTLTCTKTGYSWAGISISAMSDNLTGKNFTNAWWATGGIAGNLIGAWRVDGRPVNPFIDGYPPTYGVISVVCTGALPCNRLGYDRIYNANFMKVGEVIVYSRALSLDEVMTVERYLAIKWRLPGYYVV